MSNLNQLADTWNKYIILKTKHNEFEVNNNEARPNILNSFDWGIIFIESKITSI